jgi:hypothetical protein
VNTYIREPINGLTHLAGAILSFVALIAMVIKASMTTASPLSITAVIIFGLSMILLYAASATYHMVIAKEKVISFLRRLDHSMIFILIAGTYTPFCLISLKGCNRLVIVFVGDGYSSVRGYLQISLVSLPSLVIHSPLYRNGLVNDLFRSSFVRFSSFRRSFPSYSGRNFIYYWWCHLWGKAEVFRNEILWLS